jgi:hypothetical protein
VAFHTEHVRFWTLWALIFFIKFYNFPSVSLNLFFWATSPKKTQELPTSYLPLARCWSAPFRWLTSAIGHAAFYQQKAVDVWWVTLW